MRNERQKDVSFYTVVARRATIHEKRTGGTRVLALRLRTILPEDCTLMDALKQIQERQSLVYRHADIDFLEVGSIVQNAYYKGDQMGSHLSVSMTFQPFRLELSDGTKLRTLWYGNGAASQGMYLTIMDGDGTGALRCYYEYKTAVFKKETVRAFHNEIINVIMAAVENKDITIGELLDVNKAQSASQSATPSQKKDVAL
jgi:hypothetical protein